MSNMSEQNQSLVSGTTSTPAQDVESQHNSSPETNKTIEEDSAGTRLSCKLVLTNSLS